MGHLLQIPFGSGYCPPSASVVFLVFTARADESECIQFFGSAYNEYMKKTKMFIPFVF